MNDIPPPKPKKPQGIKRTKGLQDDLKKAKRATRIAIKKQETKVAKAQTKLVSARLSAESKKKSFLVYCLVKLKVAHRKQER